MELSLNNYLNQCKQSFLEHLNDYSMMGFEFRLVNGHYVEYAIDERAKEHFRATGLSDEMQQVAYENMYLYGKVPFDYNRLENRLKSLLHFYNELQKRDGKREVKLPIHLLYTSWMNAKLWKESSGGFAILIHAGIGSFQKWCIFHQFYQKLLNQSSKLKSKYITDRTSVGLFDPELFKLSKNINELRRLLKRIAFECHGDMPFTYNQYGLSRQFEDLCWNNNERELKLSAEYENRNVNWDVTEAFLLFHEVGHYQLGHHNELSEWQKTPAKNQLEKERRARRRRQMEFEADKYSLPHATAITEATRNLKLGTINAKDMEKNRNDIINIFNPIMYYFMVLYFAENKWKNSEEHLSYYPSSLDRLDALFKESHLTAKAKEFIISTHIQMQMDHDISIFVPPTFE